MTENAPEPDRPALPRDAFRVRRAAGIDLDKPALQPVVVTPAYDDPVMEGPRVATANTSETLKQGRRPSAEREPRSRARHPFEDYGERASQRPYALRLPDAIDLLLRHVAAEERTHPLRIVDRALYDYFKRMGRLPPAPD